MAEGEVLDLSPVPAAAIARRRQANVLLALVACIGAFAGMGIVLMFGRPYVAAPSTTAPASASAAKATSESEPAGIESTPPPTWTGSRRVTREPDGSKTIAFTLAATHDVPAWMSRARPALVVRCLYRATEVFVALDTSTSYEDDADRRTVSVQWDGDPVTTQRWAISETGRELFAPDGEAFVKRLASARQLRFGFTPFNATPVVSAFVTQGFDELGPLVAGACGWRY